MWLYAPAVREGRSTGSDRPVYAQRPRPARTPPQRSRRSTTPAPTATASPARRRPKGAVAAVAAADRSA
jgi:hypothetical protein